MTERTGTLLLHNAPSLHSRRGGPVRGRADVLLRRMGDDGRSGWITVAEVHRALVAGGYNWGTNASRWCRAAVSAAGVRRSAHDLAAALAPEAPPAAGPRGSGGARRCSPPVPSGIARGTEACGPRRVRAPAPRRPHA